jgi:hypothetical protein
MVDIVNASGGLLAISCGTCEFHGTHLTAVITIESGALNQHHINKVLVWHSGAKHHIIVAIDLELEVAVQFELHVDHVVIQSLVLGIVALRQQCDILEVKGSLLLNFVLIGDLHNLHQIQIASIDWRDEISGGSLVNAKDHIVLESLG